MSLLKHKKISFNDEDVNENYETRHSTEPNRQIIKINVIEKINFLPKSQFSRPNLDMMNETFSYNSNNYEKSITISPCKTARSDYQICKTESNLNRTQTVKRQKDTGFSFLNSNNSKKNTNSFRRNFTSMNCIVVDEICEKRNLTENFEIALKSNRSSDNFFKRQVKNANK